jgi:3-dehydrosphinganine reductase
MSFFADRRVVITGASSGIGLSLAKQVAQAGADVVLIARRTAQLEEAQRLVQAGGGKGRIETVSLDISQEADVNAAVARVLQGGKVDVLVNNAGVVMPGRFIELPMSEFHAMMNINYFGTVHMCRALVPHMIENGGGRICNVSSLAGVIGIYGYSAYAASKFAICGFSQALRAELFPHGIAVSVCMPPDTDTPQLAFENQFKPAETKAIAGTVKALSPDAVATTIARGIAQGTFEIFADFGSRAATRAHGIVPGIVRWFCDSAQRKAQS